MHANLETRGIGKKAKVGTHVTMHTYMYTHLYYIHTNNTMILIESREIFEKKNSTKFCWFPSAIVPRDENLVEIIEHRRGITGFQPDAHLPVCCTQSQIQQQSQEDETTAEKKTQDPQTQLARETQLNKPKNKDYEYHKQTVCNGTMGAQAKTVAKNFIPLRSSSSSSNDPAY